MNNPVILKELNDFSSAVSDQIIDCVKSKEYLISEEDDWFVEELRFKKGLTSDVEKFFWLGYYLPKSMVTDDEECEEVTITVAVFKDKTPSVSADNCPLAGSPVGLHLNVFLKDSVDDFVEEEIHNAVRHELEHIVQDDFEELVDYLDYHKVRMGLASDPTHMCLYLTQPQEVSAHVRGYQAVTSDILEFSKKVGDLLEGYVLQRHITVPEKSAIFWCWKDWYDRNNYNSVGLEKFDG